MPARITDEELEMMPPERRQQILKTRERSQKTDVKERRKKIDQKNADKNKEKNDTRWANWSSKPENAVHLKEYQKNHRSQNKEQRKEYMKEWYSRPETKEKRKIYNANNADRIRETARSYNQTDGRKKFNKINSWKMNGFKHTPEQFDAIYAKYKEATECELCSTPVVDGGNKNRKCADHHHTSGCFRNIVCPMCNSMRMSQDIARSRMESELYRFFLRRSE